MHVVGEAQRRPKSKRHISEKVMAKVYVILFLVKYITFLITLVTINIAADKTFGVSFWLPKGYSLSTILTAKLSACEVPMQRDGWYAFDNVSMTITSENNVELFTDFGGQLRTGIIFAGVSIVLGALNMRLFQENIYVLRWRNVFLHKDVITTLEAVLLSLTFYTFYHAEDQGAVLRAYLRACEVHRESYLPFVEFTALYVFIGVGAGGYALGWLILLYNVAANNIVKGGPPEKQRDSDVSEDSGEEEADHELRATAVNHPQYPPPQQQYQQQQQPYAQQQQQPLSPSRKSASTVKRLDAQRPPPIQRPLVTQPNTAMAPPNSTAFGQPISQQPQQQQQQQGRPQPRATPLTSRQASGRMFTAPPPPPESFYLHQNTM